MSLRDRVSSLLSMVRSVAFLTVSDHPENGGITGDLDPEDWSDDPPDDRENNPDDPPDDREGNPDDRPESPAEGPWE